MPFNSLLPNSEVTLDLPEIQGDVLIGLKKNAEVFVFFEITDVARFRSELGTIFQDITFSDRMKAIEEAKQAGPIPFFLGLNVAFTASGLQKVGLNVAGLEPEFMNGAAAARGRLADGMNNWLPAYHDTIDAALLVTGVDPTTAANQADALINALRHSIRVVRQEPGLVRAGAQKGHEHFGFEDGISQPGVLGLTAPGAKPDQGLPGQDLVKAGEFVFGYESETAAAPAVPQPWMRNGSYLVFRRLRQHVDAFHAYVASQVAASGLGSADRLGAHLIGRWASGAPTALAPAADDPGMAQDPTRNNDFEFGGEDPNGAKCPFVGHIRKMYPRDDFGPGPLHEEPEHRRIIRAGIPFGRDADADKGLLFACYQTSIADKFEFLQTTWANSPNFMFGKTDSTGAATTPGLDITIGQGGPRTSTVNDPQRVLADAPVFVENTGAVYLFSPSRTTLQQIVNG